MVKPIRLLGDPVLTRPAAGVVESGLPEAIAIGRDLHDTMLDFRARHGWGRAIAAPQIGVLQRIVCVDTGEARLFINPRIADASDATIDLWDDCMSFPDLLVRVRRHVSFTMQWRDERWVEHERRIEGSDSELLQHEIDHLDGILAVARAIDGGSFALQSQRHLLRGAAFANRPRRD